jgi:hypothetical protein
MIFPAAITVRSLENICTSLERRFVAENAAEVADYYLGIVCVICGESVSLIGIRAKKPISVLLRLPLHLPVARRRARPPAFLPQCTAFVAIIPLRMTQRCPGSPFHSWLTPKAGYISTGYTQLAHMSFGGTVVASETTIPLS